MNKTTRNLRTFVALIFVTGFTHPAVAAFVPVGPQNDVSLGTVTGTWGWTVCYSGAYADTASLNTLLAGCSGDTLMLAARQVGASVYDVLAAAPRADVLFECGATSSCAQPSNGSVWYFSNSFSWGFAGLGDAVNRNSCDILGPTERDRLCWHTGGGGLNPGYRSGNNLGLNGASDWIREVLVAAPVPVPGALWLFTSAVAALGCLKRSTHARVGVPGQSSP